MTVAVAQLPATISTPTQILFTGPDVVVVIVSICLWLFTFVCWHSLFAVVSLSCSFPDQQTSPLSFLCLRQLPL
ncbi:unnamed protein product [Heligmosomoides polygyrus]|uniref:Ovule protein n=1 Tax=Heligmosomoides polygyrus TaxID=6339 RepID=A0A183GB68_HELPZ|nr:unnamed protein product [Heligmosomoides polygyrus]